MSRDKASLAAARALFMAYCLDDDDGSGTGDMFPGASSTNPTVGTTMAIWGTIGTVILIAVMP
jgi:hypothetical protein